MKITPTYKVNLLHRKWPLLVAIFAALASVTCQAQAQQFYQLESAVRLKGAAPGWDYLALDPARSYLYIGRRQDGVTVYDVKAKKVVGSIEDSQGANMTTLVGEFDRGYTTNGDGSTTVFQLSTLKTIERIKLGEDADAAYYEPVTKQLAFMRGDSKEITFLDAKTGSIVTRLKMDSEKLEAAAPDGQGNFFQSLRDKNAVARIDAKQHKVTAVWHTPGCEEPTGLAVDSANKRIFVGCRGKNPVLAILDWDSGKLIATPAIGRGNDGVVYDPDTRKIYTSNGIDSNLVIFDQVDADTYKLAEATTTRPYARTMALDPNTKQVYMVTAEGTVDPSKKVTPAATSFYPNKYFSDTFTLLTFSRR